jgi:hypothetical protein
MRFVIQSQQRKLDVGPILSSAYRADCLMGHAIHCSDLFIVKRRKMFSLDSQGVFQREYRVAVAFAGRVQDGSATSPYHIIYILLHRSRKEMFVEAARRIITGMSKEVRNETVFKEEREAMSPHQLPCLFRADPDLPVAFISAPALELKATVPRSLEAASKALNLLWRDIHGSLYMERRTGFEPALSGVKIQSPSPS